MHSMMWVLTKKLSVLLSYKRIVNPSVILILFLLPYSLLAITTKSDSLKELLNSTQDDSLLGEIYIKLGVYTSEHEAKKAIEYLEKSLHHFTNANFTLGKARTLNSMGYHYWLLGQYSQAIEYYEKSLNIYTSLHDSAGIGRVSNNLGAVYWGLNDYNRALEYYQRSLAIRRIIGSPAERSIVLNNIGLIYQAWFLFDQALEFHNQAVVLAESENNKATAAYSYYNLGRCLEATGKTKEALEYYRTAYDNYRDAGRIGGSTSLVLKGMGDLFFNEEEYGEALYYYRKAANDAGLENNVFHEAGALLSLAKTFFVLEEPDSAEFYADQVLLTAMDYRYDQIVRDTYYLYSDLLDHDGNYKEALKYYKMATAINDSIFNNEKGSRFTELQIRYNLEKEKQEIEILTKNSGIQSLQLRREKFIRNVSIFGALLFLIAFGFVLYQSRNLKQINREKEQEIAERKGVEKQVKLLLYEKEILLKEVHHRIKNNMSTVRNLLSFQAKNIDDPNIQSILNDAVSRLQSMGVLYDKLYKSENLERMSVKKYLPALVEEIISVFPNRDNVRIQTNIDNFEMDVDVLSPLGIIVTELITNAMKYAFTDRKGGTIQVSLKKKNGENILTVSNDGNPLPTDFSINQSKGYGLHLVSLLAGQLNGTIDIDKTNETQFILRFPET